MEIWYSRMQPWTTKWDKEFKNGPSKICGRQPLKIWKIWYEQTISLQFFKDCVLQNLLGPFLNTLSQMLIITGLTAYSQYHLRYSRFNYRVGVLEPAFLWLWSFVLYREDHWHFLYIFFSINISNQILYDFTDSLLT